jgi:hypothetical protein
MLHSTQRDTSHSNETENDVDRFRIRGKADIQASLRHPQYFLVKSSLLAR